MGTVKATDSVELERLSTGFPTLPLQGEAASDGLARNSFPLIF